MCLCNSDRLSLKITIETQRRLRPVELETITNHSQHYDQQNNDPPDDDFPTDTGLPNYYYPAGPISLRTPLLFRL